MFALALATSVASVIALYIWGIYDTHTDTPYEGPWQVRRTSERDWFEGTSTKLLGHRHHLTVVETYKLRDLKNREPERLQAQFGAVVYDHSRDRKFTTILAEDEISPFKVYDLVSGRRKDINHANGNAKHVSVYTAKLCRRYEAAEGERTKWTIPKTHYPETIRRIEHVDNMENVVSLREEREQRNEAVNADKALTI